MGQLGGIKRRIHSTHFVQDSQDFCKVPIYPRGTETETENGTYKVEIILKEKL